MPQQIGAPPEPLMPGAVRTNRRASGAHEEGPRARRLAAQLPELPMQRWLLSVVAGEQKPGGVRLVRAHGYSPAGHRAPQPVQKAAILNNRIGNECLNPLVPTPLSCPQRDQLTRPPGVCSREDRAGA
jgi:hypothetical protein